MDKQPTNCFCTDDHDDDTDLLPLTEAKRRASHVFEGRYLFRVMKRANGSVSEGARLSGLDRTNFRRLLHRHGIDPVGLKRAAQAEAAQVDVDQCPVQLAPKNTLRLVGAAS